MNRQTQYEVSVQERTRLRYLIGLFRRWMSHIRYEHYCRIAKRNGASVGDCVVMTKGLAGFLNENFKIGSHSSLHNVNFSSNLHKTIIGEHVIIGAGVKIVRGTHNIDSPEWEDVVKNELLEIEDYVWLCPDAVIMPSVKKIGYGAVIGANAVVVKDVAPMSVVGGNPAKELRKRTCIHRNLVVESLLGGDYLAYKQAWKNRAK